MMACDETTGTRATTGECSAIAERVVQDLCPRVGITGWNQATVLAVANGIS